ncbi:hypothetical protein N6Q81_03310, partial [Streptomyces vinaceusdrappus]
MKHLRRKEKRGGSECHASQCRTPLSPPECGIASNEVPDTPTENAMNVIGSKDVNAADGRGKAKGNMIGTRSATVALGAV